MKRPLWFALLALCLGAMTAQVAPVCGRGMLTPNAQPTDAPALLQFTSGWHVLADESSEMHFYAYETTVFDWLDEVLMCAV